MKPIYLNIYNKEDIRTSIAQDVRKKVEKSDAKKELSGLKKEIIKSLREIIKEACPETDVKILRKYDLVSVHDKISICLDKEDRPQDLFYGRRQVLVINIKPPLFAQEVCRTNQFLINLVIQNPELCDLCVSAFKINDHLECEVNDTVNAYMDRVDKFKTVRTLIAKYPNMKKFMPKQTAPAPVQAPAPQPTDPDQRIARFEASV